MASGMSVYSAGLLLNKILRNVDFTPNTSYWVAAFNNNNSGAALRANNIGGASEVSGNSYARVEVRGNNGYSGGTGIHWAVPDPVTGSTNQSSDIVFTAASGSWGTVYAIALMDSVTVGAGNVIVYSELTVPKPITAPDVLRIPINQFIITM